MFGRYGKVPMRAIVEFVRDGAALRCLLLEPMMYVGLLLAGVLCPRLGSAKPATEGATEVPQQTQPEPFALQAKYFTEVRFFSCFVELNYLFAGMVVSIRFDCFIANWMS